jgi:beta-lactamase regulating signal transducer with metallopeptidase domain
MSTLFLVSAASAGLWVVVKASVLLGLGGIVQSVFCRRASSASRHLVWTLAIASVLVLPVASAVLPDWAVVIRTAPPTPEAVPTVIPIEASSVAQPFSTPAGVDRAPAPPQRSSLSWPGVIASAYLIGLIGMLIHLLAQYRSARWIVGHSAVVQDAEWTRLLADCADRMGVRRRVRLLRSREHTVPLALGTWRPAIVIPSIADSWEDDRRRAVILHELAHVIRYDCLTQALAVVSCAMYWFHPASWWIARRLRIERELACDDRVIAAGTEAREYAGHLLEIAYSFGCHRARALALGMARPRQLEGRLLAALDAARDRRVPALRVRLASAAAAAAVLLSIAGATPTIVAANAPGEPATVQTIVAAGPQRVAIGPAVLKDRSLQELAQRGIRAAAAAVGIAQEGLPGTWEIRPTDTNGTVHLRLVELKSSSGSDIRIEQLEGLTLAQLTGAGGPVQFRLRRDAGTFTFEGVVRNGVGAGTFTFTADANFPAELAKRGLARPTAAEQYQLARHDVGYAFLDALNAQGYAKPQTSDLVRAGQHGVDTAYVRDMGALGYRLGSLDPLITLRDHGITPAYVRELADQGYKGLSADNLRQARDHGITPDYVRGMREAGYRSLPMDALINARDHGVTPEFVRGLANAGHPNPALDQAIRLRDHGVTPEYVGGMRQLGFTLPTDELVQARDHGVTVEYVRAIAALGYGSQPMTSLIRLRDHGVTPQYAQEVKALGYDQLPLEDLVMLRDHGLTADRIRAANARAGTRLPIDMLKSLAGGGMR